MSADLLFFPGLHQPGDARHFALACISINRLTKRKKKLLCSSVFVDSGAFTELEKNACYPDAPEVYAGHLHRLWTDGVVNIVVASTQDYMCEPFMLAKTGLTVLDHQRLTIERYDAILAELYRLFDGPPPFEFMPVLQGFEVEDYLRHIEMYGDRLTPGMWVGVGSVCKRQGDASVIEALLLAIKEVRPDLRLHGFWCEVHRAAESYGTTVASQRRQHGLVFRRQESTRSYARDVDERTRSSGFGRRSARDLRSTRYSSAQPKRLARGKAVRVAHQQVVSHAALAC